jgi:hypothetical protein
VPAEQDYYTLLSYSIVGGNSNSMFSIDSGSGLISLAGKLAGAAQDQYLLTVLMSDETLPVTRTATSSYPTGASSGVTAPAASRARSELAASPGSRRRSPTP